MDEKFTGIKNGTVFVNGNAICEINNRFPNESSKEIVLDPEEAQKLFKKIQDSKEGDNNKWIKRNY